MCEALGFFPLGTLAGSHCFSLDCGAVCPTSILLNYVVMTFALSVKRSSEPGCVVSMDVVIM